VSFPEALSALFLETRHPIVLCGTHGKTTTTSLVAWLLTHAGRAPGFLIGGVARNFGRSFEVGQGDTFVVEGDEYDTAYFDKRPKFVHYRPRTAVLTSIEFDHADIYRDLDHVISSFELLASLVAPDGDLFVCGEDALAVRVARTSPARVHTYGIDGDFDWVASEVSPERGGMAFRLRVAGEDRGRRWTPLTGRHNVLNTLAALGAAAAVGVEGAVAAEGLARFEGVVKRQEVKGEPGGVLVVDDYAHHPTAVRETIAAIRLRYPGRRLWALFEAESNTSRRRIFQDTYPEALAAADRVVLSKPLKKNDSLAPEDQIDVARIVSDLRARGTEAWHIAEFDDIAAFVSDHAEPGDVVLGMSGRDFGDVHAKIIARLEARLG
jgi:UDP-N-acetylmuramate: L-alanyl-gamma-D-glutamyl-meso-diaminopimelate ligase